MKLAERVLCEALKLEKGWKFQLFGHKTIQKRYDREGRLGVVSSESGKIEWALYEPYPIWTNPPTYGADDQEIQSGECDSFEDGMEACDQAYEEEFGS